ncbi:MAG: sulfite exporter TauE/SafE family protein [Anaerolineae bacterium]|nr:sulfite exporter TauE/SafE family protein [Anaerolineae bacterium]
MSPFLIALIIFFAIFTQSVAGFGLALISMPLLIEGLGVEVAAPLVALVAITAELILLIRYRHALNVKTLERLSLASLVGIPIGVFVASHADERLVLTLLGLVVTLYALYALLRLRLPAVQHPNWAFGFGFIGGILSGAYNASGPPVVIYGTCRGWSPAEFKSNLQGFFFVNSVMVIVTHTLAHHYTPYVWENYLAALPGLGLGLVLGLSLDRFVNPVRFRQIVLVLLVAIGINLILP